MNSWRYWPISFALILALVTSGSVGAATSVSMAEGLGAPPEATAAGQIARLFQSYGQDGHPGVWLFNGADGSALWLPAEVVVVVTQSADQTPAWPDDPAKLVVIPVDDQGTYWVWDVFRFTSAEGGSSRWSPHWRLVSNVALLGE